TTERWTCVPRRADPGHCVRRELRDPARRKGDVTEATLPLSQGAHHGWLAVLRGDPRPRASAPRSSRDSLPALDHTSVRVLEQAAAGRIRVPSAYARGCHDRAASPGRVQLTVSRHRRFRAGPYGTER